MHKLHVIFTSTRPTRAGEPLAKWIVEHAQSKFETKYVDLRAINLPIFDEPKHPRLGQYEHEHTKKWSALIKEADAFVFVMPEYNYSMPVAFVNAVTYLASEWFYKAAGIVSYGGVSAGVRAAQQAKQLLTTMKIMPVPEAVSVPMFTQFIGEDKVFKGNEALEKGAHLMFDELDKWTGALKTIR